MSAHYHRARARVFGLVILAVVLFGSMPLLATPSTVVITSPRPKSVLMGIVRVFASIADDANFAYAMLSINTESRSVSNALPVHFTLDTTQYPNGPHTLQVDIFDKVGLLASSPKVPVIIANPIAGETSADKPLPTTPAPVTPKPVSPTPVPPATPKHQSPKANRRITAKQIALPPTSAQIVPHPVSATSSEHTTIQVLLDGTPIVCEIAPVVMNGHTMIMLRPIVRSLGGIVTWNQGTHTAVAKLDQREVTFILGQQMALVDGGLTPLDAKIIEKQDRMLIPATFIQQLFGGNVAFNPSHTRLFVRSHPAFVRARIAAN